MTLLIRVRLSLAALFCLACASYGFAQQSRLQRQGTATQLVIGGRPTLILGGELGNSSASCAEDIERNFLKLQQMGLNTVLVPAYWDMLEPQEGQFDFSLTDKALGEARKRGLKVVFLWFGAWKNSMSCYAPLWFKQDTRRFPRAQAEGGKPLEIASVFSQSVLEADRRAFTAWLRHIAETDAAEGTVVMIQVENEIGMLESARDHSAEADKAFCADVPQRLTDYLKKHKKELHPQILEKWQQQGCKTAGSWQEVFGADIYTDEIFMAWHYAGYVEQLAQAARSLYDVPLYVNAAMNSRGRKPGEYPSAGPLAHLIDVWHCGAPSIDILAPDLYDNGFTEWVAQYHRTNNPLFIPEIRLTDNDGVRAFYVFGEHDAIGFSPFSIEDYGGLTDGALVQGYRTLRELMPLITRHQGRGTMHGLLFDQEQKERTLTDGELTITARHNFTLPWNPRATNGEPWPEGGGILIKLAKNEYIVAGSGIVVEFGLSPLTPSPVERGSNDTPLLGEDGFALAGSTSNSPLPTGLLSPDKRGSQEGVGSGERLKRCGLGTVDEVSVAADGSLSRLRRMNGDQTHQGRHVRISVGEFKILHVTLYEYE